MKKFGLILAGCLAFISIYGAHAEDIGDVARAGVRRTSTSAITSNRQKVPSTTRSGTNSTHTAPAVRNRVAATTSVATRGTPVVERSTVARTSANVVPRTNTATTKTSGSVRAARSGTRATPQRQSSRTVSRAASTNTVTREDVLSRDYSKCKSVFFDCMDEFCANKDAQLKRCACSSRIHEFDSVKRQLAAAEEKMLDFNQRLLTVSMDKEDAAALSVATAGEDAYLGTTDTTNSKKTLDAIAKKLNTSFDSNRFNTDLNVLSWSLNADSAFDNVDSLMGASTTTKSGTELYSAALPICRDMAQEVCSESDAKLAESGYLAAIEQDCNTVAKTYKTQVDQARAKVLEGSALLDMSRLDVYQKRNSDDILTCKKKMLDMLTDSTVCGSELGKCLDVTGRYIDPSTGDAFLTPDLVNLGTLLSRPDENSTWSTMPDNSAFVTFLESKRKFLEPAMENCQNIADHVWDTFIDDALSQIKLAQDKKLEDIRRGCTTLTAQCLSDATKSITDFDARALSIFGISADRTANAMCSDVLESCSALLNSDGGESEWTTGISEIMTTNTYETLMQTCRQVGRACIIQVCTSTSGNFGLCESISNSTNRKSIVNHTACWDQVKDCVASAGDENIEKIFTQLGKTEVLNFYQEMYGNNNNLTTQNTIDYNSSACITEDGNCIYDMCASDCQEPMNTDKQKSECRACRLAENIWGNCEVDPSTELTDATSHNRIIQPSTGVDTLLYWFAQNTNTANANDSCRDTTCGVGYKAVGIGNQITCIDYKTYNDNMCYPTTPNGENPYAKNYCGQDSSKIETADDACQCVAGTTTDTSGNYCASVKTITDCATGTTECTQPKYCANGDNNVVLTQPYTKTEGSNQPQYVLLCVGGTMENNSCTGYLVEVEITTSDTNQTYHYLVPSSDNYTSNLTITESAITGENCKCTYTKTNDNWAWQCANGTSCNTPTHWVVEYSVQQTSP